jgi:hypothetical protein
VIRFACSCRQHLFDLPDEQAGTQVQCPACGRLNDVPSLNDLAAISEDGTYKIETPQERQERDRLAKLQRSFSRSRTDDAGREIDLRLTEEDLENVGADQVPLELKDAVRPGAPKYDPVTGELVRPMDLKDDGRVPIDPESVPLAKAVITYASGETGRVFNAWRIFPELFNFANSTVVLSVFLAHVVLQLMMFGVAILYLLIAPFALALMCLLMAHYAIVVNDIGYGAMDELPRPLRDLDFRDDLWHPLLQFVTAVVLSYGWIGFAVRFPPALAIAFAAGVLVIGTILFPALLLTLTTSGSVLNLRPDRVLSVMARCGGGYVMAVMVWAWAGTIYLAGFIGTLLPYVKLWYAGSLPSILEPPMYIVYPLLLTGVYAMHGFCWYLGLQYRHHHDRFPWVMQFHTRSGDEPAMSRRRAATMLPDVSAFAERRARMKQQDDQSRAAASYARPQRRRDE